MGYQACTIYDEPFGPSFDTPEGARDWAAINAERDAAIMANDLLDAARDDLAKLKPYHFDYEAILAVRASDDPIVEAVNQARELIRRHTSVRYFE